MSTTVIPDPTDMPATMSVPATAELIGISRSACYRGVASGQIPSIRIGGRLLVPTAKLFQMLGWLPDPND